MYVYVIAIFEVTTEADQPTTIPAGRYLIHISLLLALPFVIHI